MSIKLVENTGYKYDLVYRFCGWEHAEDIRPVKTCGAETIGEFYLACLKAWNTETCSERFRPEWSASGRGGHSGAAISPLLCLRLLR